MNKAKLIIAVLSGSMIGSVAFAGDTKQSKDTSTNKHYSEKASKAADVSVYSKKTIREAQEALNTNGFAVTVDGVIGESTRKAIKSFQNENDLDVTGRLDTATLTALNVSAGMSEGRVPASVENEAPPLPATTD